MVQSRSGAVAILSVLLLLMEARMGGSRQTSQEKVPSTPNRTDKTDQEAQISDVRHKLQGVWELESYRSTIKPEEKWVGIMIITRGYISRVYMAKARSKLPFDYETQKLTCQQRQQVIESYKLFRAGSGQYDVSGSTLTIEPLSYYNPVNFGKKPRRVFRLQDGALVLNGVSSNGDRVEEVWKRVE